MSFQYYTLPQNTSGAAKKPSSTTARSLPLAHIDSGFTASGQVTYTLTAEAAGPSSPVNIVGPLTFTALPQKSAQGGVRLREKTAGSRRRFLPESIFVCSFRR